VSTILLFLSSFSVVFLLVFQQMNVHIRHYWLAALTSIAITQAQFIVVKGFVSDGLLVNIAMTAGGVLGVLSSMASHDRLTRWYADRQKTNESAMEAN
jgi:Kef-type K+ transport system membrane component KefB